MAKIIDELITKFTFKANTHELKKATESVEKLKEVAKTAGLTFGAIFGIDAIKDIAENASQMLNLSKQIGITVSQLDRLQLASEKLDVSQGEVDSTLQNVTFSLGQAQRGMGAGLQALTRYGISFTDLNGNVLKTNEFLKILNERFQGLTKAQQADVARSLQIGNNFLRVLQQTPEQYNKSLHAAGKYGLVTKKTAEEAEKFNKGLVTLRHSLHILTLNLGVVVFPIVNKFITVIVNIVAWLSKSKIVVDALTAALVIFAARSVKSLLSVGAEFLKFSSPVRIAITVLTTVIWLVKQVIDVFNGQDNTLAHVIKKWGWFGKVVKMVVEGLKLAYDAVGALIRILEKLAEKTIGKVGNAFKKIGQGLNFVGGYWINKLHSLIGDNPSVSVNHKLHSNFKPSYYVPKVWDHSHDRAGQTSINNNIVINTSSNAKPEEIGRAVRNHVGELMRASAEKTKTKVMA